MGKKYILRERNNRIREFENPPAPPWEPLEPDADPPEDTDDMKARKQELIREIKSRGEKADGRMSIENLEAQLEALDHPAQPPADWV